MSSQNYPLYAVFTRISGTSLSPGDLAIGDGMTSNLLLLPVLTTYSPRLVLIKEIV